MPRYLIERTFPDGLAMPVNAEGAQAALGVVGRNAEDGVTWIGGTETLAEPFRHQALPALVPCLPSVAGS